MIEVVLSYFDNLIGPRIFLKIPDSPSPMSLEHVPILMDLFKDGFFLHEFGDLKTANLIFNIDSPIARGRKELLMLSIISHEEKYNINLNSFRQIMELLVYELSTSNDLYKILHYKKFPGSMIILKKAMNMMYSFYDILPKGGSILRHNFAKVLSYELTPTGINSIMNTFQAKISQPVSNNELIYDNFKID